VEYSHPSTGKEILAVIKGIEIFLIFLGPKPFFIQTNCKGMLLFMEKNLSNIQAKEQFLHWQ